MFAQTFYDLFAIKENRDNCLEVPQSWDEEYKSTEKLASWNLHWKNFFVLSKDEKQKKKVLILVDAQTSECFT